MSNLFFVGIMCVIWAASLFNGTGLGNTYHTTEYFKLAMLTVSVFLLFRKGNLSVNRKRLFLFLALLLVFLGSALVGGHLSACLQYLSCFLLVFVLSNFEVHTAGMKMTGFVFAGLGACVLAVFDFGNVFSGWNENSIAMIGLFSYLIFAAAFFNLKSPAARLWLVLVTGIYVWLLWPTDSRSCEITIILMCLIVLFGSRRPIGMRSEKNLWLYMLLPLIIAAAVCLLAKWADVAGLDEWSYARFGKPIFNGRDEAWQEGFRILKQHFLFGTGDLFSGTWHNAAVSCFTAYGAAGYVLWAAMMVSLLGKGLPYREDFVVRGCITVFLVMNFQQSFELGMIAPNYNFLIYLPLGLLLGRVRYLKGRTGV